jgi:hypothetical protein
MILDRTHKGPFNSFLLNGQEVIEFSYDKISINNIKDYIYRSSKYGMKSIKFGLSPTLPRYIQFLDDYNKMMREISEFIFNNISYFIFDPRDDRVYCDTLYYILKDKGDIFRDNIPYNRLTYANRSNPNNSIFFIEDYGNGDGTCNILISKSDMKILEKNINKFIRSIYDRKM